jgi:S1-C subfamily serine protease
MRSVLGIIGVALTTAVVTSAVIQGAFARVPQPIVASPAPIMAAPAVVSVGGGPGARSVRAVVESARPAVVQITTAQIVLDRLGRPSATPTGVGSGVIYDPSGLILTNNHVVDGATQLLVSLPDGRVYPGTLVGGDPQMDLAVVRITPERSDALPVAPLGDAEQLAVGDGLVAIGNALGLPGGPTVTAGVVSALGRAVQEPSDTPSQPGPYLYDLIQTDASINPGNSGGPLLNMAGEVIGINTIGAGGAGGGGQMAQGIGFAIAINTARPIADGLIATGKVSHPYLGISYAPLTRALATQLGIEPRPGLVIAEVAPDSPSARAGLRPRDIIVAADDRPIADETSLGRAMSRRRPGEKLALQVARGSETLTVAVTLGARAAG